MGEKPTGAAILSVVGGVFVLLAGVTLIALASIMEGLLSFMPIMPFDVTGMLATWGAIGALLGLVIVVLGVLMLMKPQMAKIFGALVLVLSIVSFVVAFGGFFIGGILGVIGGILGLVFKPAPAMPMAGPPMAPPP